MPRDDNSDDVCCPICLEPKALVFAKCSHRACLECFERIVLPTFSPHANYEDDDDDNEEEAQASLEDTIISACPTHGRCPFCRCYINLFDLKHYNEPETKTETQSLNPDLDQVSEEQKFIFESNIDLKETPLNNLEFVEGNAGSRMISFKDGIPEMLLYKNINDRNELVKRQPFDGGYHYHAKSKTFSGTIIWTESEEGSSIKDKWEVVVQFSRDFRLVQHGAIMKSQICNENESSKSRQENYRYPLDGKWNVQWIRSRDHGSRQDLDFTNSEGQIKVAFNQFTFCGITYNICLGSDDNNNNDNDNGVYFDWPSMSGSKIHRQVAESGLDLGRIPEGPDIGSVVVWKVDYPDYHRILWKRVTKQEATTQVERLDFGGSRFYMKATSSQFPTERPSYNSTNLWGNVFIQGLKVGLASYHFVSPTGEGEEGAYISYEHHMCSTWPSLDDGTLVPLRVPFKDYSYDSDTRTFRGKIPWMEVYGTTWQNMSTWEYEIVFDSEFTCILKGGVTMDRDETHKYGESLNYCNAAIVESIKSKTNGDANESTTSEEWVQGIRRVIQNLKSRLLEEGVNHRTLTMVLQASNGAVHPRHDVIDYNLGTAPNRNSFNVL